MDRTVRAGDLVVCRVNGTFDVYVIGTVVSGKVGALSLRGLSTMVGQRPALWHAYEQRLLDGRVWLFDGAAAAYVEAAPPPVSDALALA
jgi:hypothetical protein